MGAEGGHAGGREGGVGGEGIRRVCARRQCRCRGLKESGREVKGWIGV